jgi:hypothetical protein
MEVFLSKYPGSLSFTSQEIDQYISQFEEIPVIESSKIGKAFLSNIGAVSRQGSRQSNEDRVVTEVFLHDLLAGKVRRCV